MLLCSGLPTQVLVASAYVRLGRGAGSGSEPSLSLSFVTVVSLADTAAILGLMLLFLRSSGPSPHELWRGRVPLWPEVRRGIAMSPALIVGVGLTLLALQRAFPLLHNVPVNPLGTMAQRGLSDAIILGTVAIVAGAIREELQRAFLLNRFERHIGPTWLGVVVLSAAFGLGHAVQGWDAAVVTGLLGALWATIYARRRSVVMPLVSHAVFNSLEIVRMVSIRS
jgi:membrane protease YdiL (CAAX protease family)